MDEAEKIYVSQRAVLTSYSVNARKVEELSNLLKSLNNFYDEEYIEKSYLELRNDPEWFDSVRDELQRNMNHHGMTQFIFDTEHYLRRYFESNVLNTAREMVMQQAREVSRDLAYLDRFARDPQLPPLSRVGVGIFPLADELSGADTDIEED